MRRADGGHDADADPRDERTRTAQANYHQVMTYPGPNPTKPYYDAGVVGFVFGEMWPREALSRRDRRWVTLACVGAAGALIPIQTHVFAAINSGDCTLQELQEFNLHFATQLGWPKGQVVDQYIGDAWASIAPTRGEHAVDAEFPRWAEPTEANERRARGESAYAEIMLAPPPAAETLFRGLGYLDYLYGEIWNRPTLSRRERRIISICCAAFVDQDVDAHLYAALKSGDLTFEELQEIVLHYAVYVGWLRAAKLDDQLLTAWRRVETEATQPNEAV
jgi:4-carboxymuconolactone decarboxylase